MVNEAWGIGDEFVLRINRSEESDDEAPREALVVPLVRSTGVRSPELIVFDDDRDIVPRPYTIYERAAGVLVGNLDIDPSGLEDLYLELGNELALLHRMPPPTSPLLVRGDSDAWNSRKQIRSALEEGFLAEVDASEMESWLDFLQPMLGVKTTDTLVHKDIHPWNLMVDPHSFALTAILDWGDAQLGDVSSEFASMPLVAMPAMLRGYSDAGESVTTSIVAKALYAGVGLAAWEIREGDMKNYKRQWWRMPEEGWQGVKSFVIEEFPEFKLPAC